MNLVRKTVFSALALSLSFGVAVLQGCASYQAAPETASDPPTQPVAEIPPASPVSSPEAVTPTDEPKAVPFEEVLKQDAQSQQQVATKKAPKPEPAPARPPSKAPTKADTSVASKKKAETPAEVATVATSPAPLPAPATPVVPSQEQAFTPLQFTLDQLPITIQNTWVLSSSQSHCKLQTRPVKMDDGAGSTPVFLELTDEAWIIATKSDIDLSYQNTGLFLDNGVHIPLETLVKDTNIAISAQKSALTDGLKTASTLQVTLGFWPTWPVSETHTHTLPVAHFPQALAAWETCNQRISAR